MSNLKRFLALTLAMLMVVGAMAVSAKSFTDVASTDSYAEAVDVLSELGVILGTSADEFSPDALVSREQMAMFIARLATAQPSWFAVEAPAVFADQKDPTYNAAIAYASSNGFVKGTDTAKNLFDGTASVTLQEAATMISRVLGYTTEAMDKAYPMSYLTMADDVKLLVGLEDVAPTAALTRGEVAIMLYNAFKAPMATTYLTSNTTGGVVVNVSIPDDLAKAKTLMKTKWNVEVKDSYLAATKDLRFENFGVKTTKTLTDPVDLANIGSIGNDVSFATISKFFPEDAIANDYLGVDLKVFIRNNKILSIDVLGDVFTTTSAAFNATTNVVTVEGNTYDLDAYGTDSLIGAYPTVNDNCFYTYVDNVITRIDQISDVSTISNGLFSIDIINAGATTQKIVYKPYAFSKVTKNSDGKLIVNATATDVITNNTVGAVENDFVIFFKGGSNKIDVIAKATKTAESEAVKLNVNAKTITLKDGQVLPTAGNTGLVVPGASLATAATADLGAKYFAYVVDGKVVHSEKVAPAAETYGPKNYYKVLGVSISAGEFSSDTGFTYKIKVVDAAGVESVKTITKVNGVAIKDTVNALTKTDEFKLLFGKLDGSDISEAIITFDADDASLVYTLTNAKSITTFKNVADSVEEINGAVTISRTGTNVYKVGSTTFVLADYSKMIVEGKDGYATLSGKADKDFGTQVLNPGIFVFHMNEAGVRELVYAYMKSSVEKDKVFAAPTVSTTFKPYVFLTLEEETSTTVTYKALNLATKTVEQLTYTGANAAAKDAIKDGIKLASDNSMQVYDVQNYTGAPKATNSLTNFRLTAGFVADNGAPYTINNTIYYQWNAAEDKLEAKSFADFATGTSYEGVVLVDSNNNAAYIISLKLSLSEYLKSDSTAEYTVTTNVTLNGLTLGANKSLNVNGHTVTIAGVVATNGKTLTVTGTGTVVFVKDFSITGAVEDGIIIKNVNGQVSGKSVSFELGTDAVIPAGYAWTNATAPSTDTLFGLNAK